MSHTTSSSRSSRPHPLTLGVMSVTLCVATAGCALCHSKLPIEQAVAVPLLNEVCPAAKTDELCGALRDAHSADHSVAQRGLMTARDIVAQSVARRLASGSRAVWERSELFYVRERVLALLAWYSIAGSAPAPEPSDYSRSVSTFLKRYFPKYDPPRFPIASLWLPPQLNQPSNCPSDRDLLLILPGVARILERNEFAKQSAALHNILPCLEIQLVDTKSFMAPSENVQAVMDAIAKFPDPARIHMFGYSQGGLNAMATLVSHPEIAARTRTVTLLDSPVHGSELGDALYEVVRPAGWFDWLWPSHPLPNWGEPGRLIAGLLREQDARWLKDEASPSLQALLHDRLGGVASLGTKYADKFWAHDGKKLPTTTLYASFRAIITDRDSNLPRSNQALYDFLNLVNDDNPYNDMQVPLVSQELGGPLVGHEVVAPVAEGNHWQWALVPGDLPDEIMPTQMVERVPHAELFLAYYSTFAEIGLLGGAH